MKFEGVYSALITPFHQGKIDWYSFKKCVDFQMKEGVNGVVVLGTTGEGPTIEEKEREEIITFLVKHCKDRLSVIVGCGTNNTKETIERTKIAKSLGADAVMIVNPYYNKPNQRGLKNHYISVANAVEIPLMMYNIKSRTSVNLEVETIKELARHPNIVAIKEASGDVDQFLKIIKETKLDVLSGDDNLACAMMMMGAKGVVSVASNVIPKEMALLSRYVFEKNYEKARELYYQYSSLFEKLFIESNPIPVKASLFMMGYIQNELRSPLSEMDHDLKNELEMELKRLGLV